jgi:hypothetical protein
MLAWLFILVGFAAWTLIGLAFLELTGADTSELGVFLTAPVLGSLVAVMPLFVLNEIGLGIDELVARFVLVAIVCSAAVVVILKRSRVPWPSVFVFGCCILALVLVGRPFLSFGFDWIANANDDMANYVLSATWLQHHGLLSHVDVPAVRQGRSYASMLSFLHRVGSRPGADIALAGYSSLTGRAPYQMFMPFILTAHLALVSATASLATQATRRVAAPILAAFLIAISPLATYGSLQELLPQTWGLAIAATFLAVAMRPALYERKPTKADVATVGLVIAGLILAYVELASTIGVAYLLFLAVLIARRRAKVTGVLRFWIVPVAVTIVLLNGYLWRELSYLANQTAAGAAAGGSTNIFAFTQVPAALPAILGLQDLPASATAPHLNATIVFAIAVFVPTAILAFVTAWRLMAVSFALVTYFLLGVYLGVHGAAFGLFKLFMYVQPFLACAFAVWLVVYVRPRYVGLVCLICIPLVVSVLAIQADQVKASRDPGDLPGASSTQLLPAFRKLYRTAPKPVISMTDNTALGKLEAAGIGGGKLLFAGRYLFPNFLHANLAGWRVASFPLLSSSGTPSDPFLLNPTADRSIRSGRCTILIPAASETVFNRSSLPATSQDLIARPCSQTKNLLVFQNSEYGESYYLASKPRSVSNFELEPDYFFAGQTMAGFGRYTLIRVLDPSGPVRVKLSLTTTFFGSRNRSLPPATLIGTTRVRFPLVGQGSARVVSPPVIPKVIDGVAFVVLDMGRQGMLPGSTSRTGIEGLYGSKLALDSRHLDAWVRDVSYADSSTPSHPPSTVGSFPTGLANPSLLYSGLYETGYMSRTAYFTLAGGPAATLHVQLQPLAVPHQHLELVVNGRVVKSLAVDGDPPLTLDAKVSRSASPRTVEFRWARATSISAADNHQAAAQLVGIALRRG